MTVEVQTQIAIVAGVLGGVCLILIIAMFALCGMLNKMKKSLRKKVAEIEDYKAQQQQKLLSLPSIAPTDDDVVSRYSQYPPVAPPPPAMRTVTPQPPPPTHSMNPSPYQMNNNSGYESGPTRYGVGPAAQLRPTSNNTGRTNPVYIDDSRPPPPQSNRSYGY